MKIRSVIPVFLFSIYLLFAHMGVGQDVRSLIKEAERLESAKKEDEAYDKYLEVLKLQPSNVAVLCKASELCSMIGHRQKQKASQLEYYRKAQRFAETALRVNPTYSDANFVMSMAMGRIALVASGKEKISAVIDIKKYAENAVRYDPGNFKAYHVLGKWHYEVSSLNTFERLAVKLFFGGLPSASFNESIKFYDKSRYLKPDFALNYLELAKAYHKNNQKAKAVEVLKKLQSIPLTLSDDVRIKQEGRELLAKLQE